MKSGWIWLPSWNSEKEEETEFVYFRKSMNLKTVPKSFRVRVSADSRYKLYINGCFCEAGPSKGDDKVWFYDEIETASYLKKGENIWAVIVLRYPLDTSKGNQSVFRTKTPGLYLEHCGKKSDFSEPVFQTDSTWKVKRAWNVRIVPENQFFAPLQIYERTEGDPLFEGWMEEGYSCKDWEDASEYEEEKLSKQLRKEYLAARTIPFMKRVPGYFKNVIRRSGVDIALETLKLFLQGKGVLRIPSHSRFCLEMDVGELMTGYLFFKMVAGAGASVALLQAECYVESIPDYPISYQDLPVKGDRTDSKSGLLAGVADIYRVCGYGTVEKPEIYEPYWFRTFRFIRMTVETKAEPLILAGLSFEETGYPLEIKTHVQTSDSSMERIWDISARTLKRCMHETYEDCPFYEQLQYAMDARSQILFTYAVSADDRLARKCIDDFRRSQRKDGLLNSYYPGVGINVIPGFSVYYIGMLYDHMLYFGDRELVTEHIPAVDRILEYFHLHRDQRGLVTKVGDLNRPGQNWSFIDWTKEWDETDGVPDATLAGAITIESFLYLRGLQYAEALNQYAGRCEAAKQYGQRAAELQNAINIYCRGKDGMYQDGPGYEKYSQHCQVFAVLTDTVSEEEGKRYLLKTLEQKQDYAQCSVAMMYYLFRALEKCELYEWTEGLWNIWREMLDKHLTTCAEDPLTSRSDCHAWGALALYELPSVVLGVRPAAPGYEKIEIRPVPGAFSWAKGDVITPKGIVSVNWRSEDGEMHINVQTPKGIEVICEKANA